MGQRMPAAHCADPPLAERQYLGIVRRHRLVDLDDRKAVEAEAHPKVRLLAGDCLLIEAADLPERGDAHGHDPAQRVHIFNAAGR